MPGCERKKRGSAGKIDQGRPGSKTYGVGVATPEDDDLEPHRHRQARREDGDAASAHERDRHVSVGNGVCVCGSALSDAHLNVLPNRRGVEIKISEGHLSHPFERMIAGRLDAQSDR